MSKIDDIKENLKKLAEDGEKLLERLTKGEDALKFTLDYEKWHTPAQTAISQIAPKRLQAFDDCYNKQGGIAAFLASGGFAKYYQDRLRVSAIGSYAIQTGIIESLTAELDSVLSEIQSVLQADFFDSELDAANNLLANGHLRASGMIAGVVLEGHLKSLCIKYGVIPGKNNPTLNDYNQELYRNGFIDNPQRAKIEALGAIRNKCAHATGNDPTQDEVEDLVKETKKSIKLII